MSFTDNFQRQRQLIPRWFTYPLAQWLNILDFSSTAEHPTPNHSLAQCQSDFLCNPILFNASDLVGQAMALNAFDNADAIRAAGLIAEHKMTVSHSIANLADNFLRSARGSSLSIPDIPQPASERHYWDVIAVMKAEVRDYPRNKIKWADLAFCYSTLGQNQKAKYCMEVAISGSPTNRFLVLSAARFFLHIGEPDRAIHFLRRSIAALEDPWTVSAEIAISDACNHGPAAYRKGRRLLEDNKIIPYHRSELAGSIGTMEIKAGSTKAGRKLFKEALIAPTENLLAQAASWENALGYGINLREKMTSVSSFEAEAQLARSNGEFKECLNWLMKWIKYQPFSSNPVIQASFISSMALENFAETIKICNIGLTSSPREFMLLNNKGYSQIELGDFTSAKNTLSLINEPTLSRSDSAVLSATRGGLAFSEGRFGEGNMLYNSACEEFKIMRDEQSHAIAMYRWALHLENAKSPEADLKMRTSLDLAKRSNLKEIESSVRARKSRNFALR